MSSPSLFDRFFIAHRARRLVGVASHTPSIATMALVALTGLGPSVPDARPVKPLFPPQPSLSRPVSVATPSPVVTTVETTVTSPSVTVSSGTSLSRLSLDNSPVPPSVLARVMAEAPDVLIVLGARVRHGVPGRHLRQRLDVALALAAVIEPQPRFLLTGGKGEAQAMARYLVQHGIHPSRLILETRSRTTVENARYSMAILKRLAGQVHRALIVTTAVRRRGHRIDDHALRALIGFRTYGGRIRLSAISVNAEPWIAPRIYGLPTAASDVARWDDRPDRRTHSTRIHRSAQSNPPRPSET